jgi:hypothetical protein
MNDIVSLYSQSQQGGELPYFVGKQYGSGWLRSIGRFAFPILKGIGRALFGTAKDVIMNKKDILPSLKDNAIDAASDLIPEVESLIYNKPKRPKISINKDFKTHGTIFQK